MADEPANAGAGRRLTPEGNAAPPLGAAVPPPVHHESPGHRRAPAGRLGATGSGPVMASWAFYLIVLAGVAAGLFIAWQGSRNAGRGAGLVGGSLLAGALARLVLPPRCEGPLSSRGKTSDVLAFAAFGAGVLGVALMLP